MHFTCVKQYGEYIVISEAGNESRFEVEWKFAALLHCNCSPSPFRLLHAALAANPASKAESESSNFRKKKTFLSFLLSPFALSTLSKKKVKNLLVLYNFAKESLLFIKLKCWVTTSMKIY